MSRIYEALQKAERERLAEHPADAHESAQRTTAQPLAAESFSSTAVAEPEPIAPDAAPLAPPQARYAPASDPLIAPASGNELDLSKVARRPWSPNFVQLPALLHRGPAVEQFRSLRSRIFELRDVSPLKSILISSGMPQEGKSYVSVNLAFSLARHKNSKVLLIDGDMRRYTTHQMLGCESQPGLADYLAGKAG